MNLNFFSGSHSFQGFTVTILWMSAQNKCHWVQFASKGAKDCTTILKKQVNTYKVTWHGGICFKMCY